MGMCCAYVIPLGKLGRLFPRDTNADDYDDVRSSRTQFDYIISQYASGGGGERFLSVSGCFQAARELPIRLFMFERRKERRRKTFLLLFDYGS